MAIPTLRQSCVGSMERLQGDSVWIINLPNTTLANNRGFVFIAANSGVTISSITDNQGNTWEQAMTPVVGGQSGHIWTAVLAANTKQITVTLVASDTFMQFAFAEFAGVSNALVATAIDGSNSATGQTTTTITNGSFTPGTSGDLIFQFIFDRTQTQLNRFKTGNGFYLLGGQTRDGFAIQYQVQVSAGAINPSMVREGGTGANYNSMGFAIKADSTKGDSTLNGKIRHVQHQNVQPSPNVTAFQFPCSGNAIVLGMFQGHPEIYISHILDSSGNVWKQAVIDNTVPSTHNGRGEIWYAENAVTGPDLIITVFWSGALEHAMLIYYDLVGMRFPNMLGDTSTAFGTQSVTGDLDTLTIQPQQQNSIIIASGGIFSHTTELLKDDGTGRFFSDMMTDPASDGSNITLDEADCFGHFYNGTDLSPALFTWQIQNNVGGVNTWSCVAAEFITGPVVFTQYRMPQIKMIG